MKKFVSLSLLSVLLFPRTAYTGTCPVEYVGDGWGYDCIFYGGDFEPDNPNANGLPNETDAIVSGMPYGAATYQNFVIDHSWPVFGLFSSSLSNLNPQSAYWEIRSGISEGNGGILVASAMASGSNFTHTPTGRNAFGFDEYWDVAYHLGIQLKPGTYWYALVPTNPDGIGRSYNANTFGLNRIGTQISDQQFWNSPFLGPNFTNADNQGVFPTFSSGVFEEWIPEPSSIVLLGTGVLAVAGVVRRRLRW